MQKFRLVEKAVRRRKGFHVREKVARRERRKNISADGDVARPRCEAADRCDRFAQGARGEGRQREGEEGIADGGRAENISALIAVAHSGGDDLHRGKAP